MAFHRLTVPSYFGGLPGGYDYINNATSGTPAFADGAEAGGVNVGTYFVGFDDDATSSNANRPAKALSQNTDFLDDLMHRDIALPVRTSDGVGAPTAGITITGPGIFMGLVGAVLTDLFHITDTNDEDIDVGGAKIVVTSAVDSGSVPVGGGFSAGNVALTFNISIPLAQGYRVYYAQRTNLATFPADGLTSTRIRNLTEVDYQVEELFRLLHGNGEAWNAAWDSTVWDLAARSMDGAYRRSTTGLGGALNVAGSGALILRDGVAPNVVGGQTARAYIDEYQALYVTQASEVGVDRSTKPFGSGGYLFLGKEWSIAGSSPSSQPTPYFYSFASYVRHTEPLVGGSPVSGHGYATSIPFNSAANIYTTGTAGVFRVVFTAGAFFWLFATNDTAISLGKDVLECTIAGIGKVALVITSLDLTDHTGATAHCSTLDGGTLPTLGAGPTAINVNWAQARVIAGGGASAMKEALSGVSIGTEAWNDSEFFCVPPVAPLTRDTIDATGAWQQYHAPVTAYFGAHVDYVTGNRSTALGWGSLQRDTTQSNYGQWRVLGMLQDDGSIISPKGELTLLGFTTAGFLAGVAAHSQNMLTASNLVAARDSSNTVLPHSGLISYGLVQGAHYGNIYDAADDTTVGNVTIDFTTEATEDVTNAAVAHQVIERRYIDGAAAVIHVLKLPINADVGEKLYLFINEGADGVAHFDVSAMVGHTYERSGTDPGPITWRITLLDGIPADTPNTNYRSNFYEFQCIFHGIPDDSSVNIQSTWIVTNYGVHTLTAGRI